MSSKLGFSEWPFHTIPDEKFIGVWCGRKELYERLNKIFEGILRRPTFKIHLVYGDFGAGKTHSIEYMLKKYREKAKLLTSGVEYDVTIRTFTQLHKALIGRLDFDTIAKWPVSPESQTWHDFASFVKAIKSDDQERKTIAMRWISGEEKSKRALSEIGIRVPADTVDTSIRAFSELTKLAGRNSSAIVLFIDEFQHLDKLNVNYKDNILNGLTKLMNSSPNYFCLIISFRLRMPMKILSIIPNSMTSRFPGDPFIEVANFSRDEAEEFVRCLLKKFQTLEVENVWFPFTDEAKDAIFEFLEKRNIELNPRSLMKAFGHVAERFEDSEEKPPISKQFTEVTLWSYSA